MQDKLPLRAAHTAHTAPRGLDADLVPGEQPHTRRLAAVGERTGSGKIVEAPRIVSTSGLDARHDDQGPESASLYRKGRRGDRRRTMVYVLADFVAAAVAVPVALVVLARLSSVPTNSLSQFGENLSIDAIFPVAVVAMLALAGFYRKTARSLVPSAVNEIKDLSVAVAAACVLALGFGALRHSLVHVMEPNATQLVAAWLAAVILVLSAHVIVRAVFASARPTKVLIIGSQAQAERIAQAVSSRRGVVVVGRVNDDPDYGVGALGAVADLPSVCREHGVNQVVVAFPAVQSEETVGVLRRLPSYIHVAIIPRFYELVSWRCRLNDLNGMAIIEVAPPHLSIWDRALKRAFDIVVAALSLIIALPFLVVFAVIIKVTSPGPVLFRQTRTGKDRRPFTIYKFRSMQTISTNHPATNGVEPVPDPGAGVRPLHEVRNKSAEQHRITGIGRFLRRTGFDELPQLLNVLGGSMSIVGPRPFTPEESVTDEGTRRFEVRPGITGLWQVSGRNDLDHQDLSRLDTLYVASWSVWWDLKIIWDTPVVMLRGSGAY